MKKIIYSFHFKTERWEIPVDIIFFITRFLVSYMLPLGSWVSISAQERMPHQGSSWRSPCNSEF